MVVTISMVMACMVVTNVLVASAATTNTPTEYFEDFESYGELNQQNTLLTLKDSGWYACDDTQLYTNVSTVAPYSSMGYKLANIVTQDGSKALRIVTAGQTKGSTSAQYGYGRALPGVNVNGAATGVYQIQFDYKPVATSNKVQFYFGLNTADGSASNATNAQHNLVSGYNTNFYTGYRDYSTLYSNNVAQGTINAADTTYAGGLVWYTVKAVVDCDARYYSVEIYNRSTGKLVSRRSPISFAANENVGFIKFSALGLDNVYAVYIDNVHILANQTNDKLIYNETFDTFSSSSSYKASAGMTTGSSTEVFTGNSYFEGYTPWRYNTTIGNAYAFGTMNNGVKSSQVVRFGNGTSSGLVYMQAGENLVTSSTQPSRGLFKTSFKFRPANIGDDVTVNVIPSVSTNIANNNACAVFKITNNNGTRYLETPDGYQDQELSASGWYQAQLFFDVVNRQLTTKITDTSNHSITFTKSISGLTAVKAIMFNVPSTSAVYMDDIKLEYCDASDVPTPAPTEAPTEAPTPTPEPTQAPTAEPTEAPVAPVVNMGSAKGAANNSNAFYYVITVTLNDGTATAFTVKHYPTDRDEAVADTQTFTVSNISGLTAKFISVLKGIPEGQENREITSKATLTYTFTGGGSGTANDTKETTLTDTKN